MNEQETIEDIIAEMRKDKRVDPNLMWDNSQVEEHDLHYADRLDAAHRRERGDAAKLREALVKIHTIAKTFIDATKMRRVTDSARLDVSNIKDLADAALATLAAPPRNCDRFATVDEARKAHEEYRGDYIMRASNKFDFPMKFEAWLFAPATEKEGGAK